MTHLAIKYLLLAVLIFLNTDSWSAPKGNPRGDDSHQIARKVQAEIQKLAGDGKPNQLLKTQSGVSFFSLPPVPCSCPTNEIRFYCTKNLSNSLKDAIKRAKEIELSGENCNPAAGCSIGITIVYLDCQKLHSKGQP